MKRPFVFVPLIAALVLIALWIGASPGALVVYCAHDAVYAEEILDEFTRQTGIRIEKRFDTEATKSLGLINLIIRERRRPRCDVFWNNELLGMVELQEQGLLEPYQGTGWKRMPDRYRDADGHWVGFAARMRVYLFRDQESSADESIVRSLLSFDPTRLAIAKPLFGTTLTHYTVLWHLWGPERLRAWHSDLVSRGLRIVNGNAVVKDLVAMGACDAGMTDTDDAFVAIDDGLPVRMLPVRLTVSSATPSSNGAKPAEPAKSKGDLVDPSIAGYTICIPNTVGIVHGTKRLDKAQRLVDFLTSAETEIALARAKSRQIPLGPIDEDRVPEEVRNLTAWARDGFDLRSMLNDRRECLKWLQSEYLK